MFATLERSWSLTKTTFSVMKQDPEMLAFPALASIFSLLYGAAILVPTVITQFLGETAGGAFGLLQWAMLFLVYFGLAFIATFFNTCVVYTAKTRFEGGDATFMDSIKFAMSRVHQIAAWSLVAASVGLFLKWLDDLARKGGVVGIVAGIIRSVLGFAWSVVTLFVIPAMVYEGVGPIDAIKSSTQTLKQTWGESLVRHFGLGLAQFIAMIPGFALFAAAFPAFSVSGVLGGIVLGLAVLYLIFVGMLFSVANSVFNTALYHFARSGQGAGGFEAATLRGAIGAS